MVVDVGDVDEAVEMGVRFIESGKFRVRHVMSPLSRADSDGQAPFLPRLIWGVWVARHTPSNA